MTEALGIIDPKPGGKAIKANYHTHTRFCDGADEPEEIVREAIAKGFDILGFSGHSYAPFDPEGSMSPVATGRYRETLLRLRDKYASKINLLIGIEQDYYSPPLTAEWDFVILSVHYVKKDGRYVAVDVSREALRADVERHWHGDYLALCEDYFATCYEAASARGDIFGHFDLVNKFNKGQSLFDEADPRYLAAAREAAEKIAANSRVVEINTGGMANGYRDASYPAPELIRMFARMDCRFILSSDCHKKEWLDFGFEEMAAFARRENLRLISSLSGKE